LGTIGYFSVLRPFWYLRRFLYFERSTSPSLGRPLYFDSRTSTFLLRTLYFCLLTSTFCQIWISYWSRTPGRSTVLVEVKRSNKSFGRSKFGGSKYINVEDMKTVKVQKRSNWCVPFRSYLKLYLGSLDAAITRHPIVISFGQKYFFGKKFTFAQKNFLAELSWPKNQLLC